LERRTADRRNEILRTEGLRKHFDGTRAIDAVSISIVAGSIVSLIGPNGAGKTTLFNVVTGFLAPDAGTVWFEGQDVTRMAPFRRVQLGMGRTFQEVRLIQRLSALENVWLSFPNQKGETAIDALLGLDKREQKRRRTEAIQWLEYVGISSGQADSPAGELSYGQQKLLSVACCLALGAKLLLLDEPVAGVSPALVEQILGLLDRLRGGPVRVDCGTPDVDCEVVPSHNAPQTPHSGNQGAGGKTIVLIEHNMDVVMRISDRVVAMDEGRIIAEGTPEEVRENAAVLEAYLG
jgi:ABC-type branched-subunit amino acid transport system ATPase component